MNANLEFRDDEYEMPIKAMNKKQLAAAYNVDRKTLNKWLKPFLKRIGRQLGYLYTPQQVRMIFECLGNP